MMTIHWLRPYWLWLLLPYLALIWLSLRSDKQDSHWQQVCDPQLLPALLSPPKDRQHRWLRLGLLWLAAVMIIALSGPSLTRAPQPLIRQSQPTMVVLDASSWMNGEDIRPTRFKRATFLLQDLFNRLPENQWGLIVFTSEPFLITPITQDKSTLSLLLQDLDTQLMPIDGHNLADALTMAADKLKTARNGGAAHILVITAQSASPQAQAVARKLAQKGITTSVIGMATTTGAPIFDQDGMQSISRLPLKSLNSLAKAGKGYYATFNAQYPLPRGIVRSLEAKPYLNHQSQQQGGWVWRDQGRYLLLLALPVMAYFFRRGLWENL